PLAMRSPSSPAFFMDLSAHEPDQDFPSIIQCPQRANVQESLWLDYIGEYFAKQAAATSERTGTKLESSESATAADLHAAWPAMLKYFDGGHALEGIAMREGLRRRTVAALVARLVD